MLKFPPSTRCYSSSSTTTPEHRNIFFELLRLPNPSESEETDSDDSDAMTRIMMTMIRREFIGRIQLRLMKMVKKFHYREILSLSHIYCYKLIISRICRLSNFPKNVLRLRLTRISG
ncbi:unnamed protein product [Rhizophagus irregularis]|nr:unnamed protein product [Rhizophagus irregularis]